MSGTGKPTGEDFERLFHEVGRAPQFGNRGGPDMAVGDAEALTQGAVRMMHTPGVPIVQRKANEKQVKALWQSASRHNDPFA